MRLFYFKEKLSTPLRHGGKAFMKTKENGIPEVSLPL